MLLGPRLLHVSRGFRNGAKCDINGHEPSRPRGVSIALSENQRLERQMSFILELDKLKAVLRRSYLPGENRRENAAEHSWHLALMAAVLCEHANERVDLGRVLQMLLVHDVIEIDAGDTYVYDAAGNAEKSDRERRAAGRIFGLLPEDQATDFRRLWAEFEAGTTAEAKFARALDRLMPLYHNYHTGGKTWREHGVTQEQVLRLIEQIREGSQRLWQSARSIVEEAVASGYLQGSGSGLTDEDAEEAD